MKRLWAAFAAIGLLSATRPADAFCGFYVSGADAKLFNDATQVALMREGTRTVLSMQNAYQGPPEDFAMVVPVPVVLQKDNVKTLPREIFAHLDQLDAPRLVEYWEQDPCARWGGLEERGRLGGSGIAAAPAGRGAAEKKDLGVTVEAQFTVGEYEIVILSAKDSSGLDTWLKQEKYKIPEGSEPFLRPYVQGGSKFFVARVDVQKVKFEGEGEKRHAVLSPVRFHYDSETFNLPVRLGLVNSRGTQDLIVHVLAKGQRYELANYPNATIPTNLDVAEAARESFGSFYAALFDRTVEKNPKAVITEYSWDAGTCDPCPGPALRPDELASLGADVLPSSQSSSQPSPLGNAPTLRGSRGGRFVRSAFSGFVLTRLHARYSKETLGQDLVFRAAPPIAGGREMRGGSGDLEHGATPSSVNNFQGRYAIRHAWGGPVECKEPRRGIWGGPPGGLRGGGPPKPALDLAFVARDAKLPSFVRSEIPELDVKGEGAPPSPAMPVANAAVPTSSPTSTGSIPAAPGADEGGQPAARKSGCLGCAVTSAQREDLAPALALGMLALATARRGSARGRRKRKDEEPGGAAS